MWVLVEESLFSLLWNLILKNLKVSHSKQPSQTEGEGEKKKKNLSQLDVPINT